MKKILLLFLSICVFPFSYALNIGSTTSGDISSYGSVIVLDEGNNIISGVIGSSNKIGFETGYNTFLVHNITNKNKKLIIECKNSYIAKIIEYRGGEYNTINFTGNIDKLILSYDYENGKFNSTINMVCNPITNPIEKFKSTTINYQNISQKQNDILKETFPITKNKFNITENDVKDKLLSGKDPDNQPTFTDIIYLQLKTIGNLSDAVINEKNSIAFSGMFETVNDFEDYNKWIDKFSKFLDKKQFEDAFSGAITLKDVGIAQDVILGLYDCLNNNNCSNNIKFKHKINDKYNIYSMDEIENVLYKQSGNNILDKSINYYNNLKNTCLNTDNIGNNFIKTQVNSICTQLLENNVDNLPDVTNYDLGYALGIRVNNLTKIKNNISGSGLNLNGIFNIYWEMNNLTLGTDKISIVKKIKTETSTDKQLELLKKIVKKDEKEIKAKKIANKSTSSTKIAIIKTQIVAFTKGTLLNTLVKSHKNLNLFDDTNFSVTKGQVQIKNIPLASENTDKVEKNTGEIQNVSLERENNFPYAYTNLKVTFNRNDSDNTQNFKKISYLYNIGKWTFPGGLYIKEEEKNNFEITKKNRCYKRSLEKICPYYTCFTYLNIKKYNNCLKKYLKKIDRVRITCSLWSGKCSAIYLKGKEE